MVHISGNPNRVQYAPTAATDPINLVENLELVVDAIAAAAVGAVGISPQPYAATPVDQSAAVNAAIAAANAAFSSGGGTGYSRVSILRPGVIYGSIKMRPGVELVLGPKTLICAMPNQTAAVIDYATYDAYHTKLRGGRVLGNRQNGATARCIDMSSSNSDAYTITIPQSGSSPDFPEVAFSGGVWDNPVNVIEDVGVMFSAADFAVFIGENQRLTMVRGLWVRECTNGAMCVAATDAHFESISLGECGDGLLVRGNACKFVSVKSWYMGRNAPFTGTGSNSTGVASSSSGNGFIVNRSVASAGGATDAYGANTFVACESNDNANCGWMLWEGQAEIIEACVSDGDTTAVAISTGAGGFTFSKIRLTVSFADIAAQETYGIIMGQYASYNDIELSVDYRAMGSGVSWAPLSLTANASKGTNRIMVVYGTGDGAVDSVAVTAAGTTTLDPVTGKIKAVALGASTTIGPVATTHGYRPELIVVFTQDATGGRVVTWDASFVGAPAPSTAAGKRSSYTFVDMAVAAGVSTPTWHCVASNLGY